MPDEDLPQQGSRPLDDEGLEEDDPDDPNNPSHPDHDLSESMPYAPYEPPPKPWYVRRWVLLVVAVVTITALVLPFIRNLLLFP